MSGTTAEATTEAAALKAALRGARRHVLRQVESLSEADRRRSTVPSGWSPIGLVRHLTLSDERYWFEVVVAGGPLDFWPQRPDGTDADWDVSDDEPTDDVLAAYRAACAASDAILDARHLDDAPLQPEPEWQADGDFPTIRSVVVHVLVETATHAGQLDVARELADGHQYVVL